MKKYSKPEICVIEISNHQSLLTNSPYGRFNPGNGGKIGAPLGPGEDWD